MQREEYERKRILYRDSLKNLNILKSPWDKAEFLSTRHRYTDALHILSETYKKLTTDDREMGYVAYAISDIYHQVGDSDKEKQYLIVSAISDLKNSVKEYISLRRLAPYYMRRAMWRVPTAI